MPDLTRRRLTAAVASASLLAGRRAAAQTVSSEATRNLPRTYSGTKLGWNMAWGTGQVNSAMIEFSREFTDATGIQLAFTSLNSDDLQQKTILDTATKTNAFDVYLNAYQWKQEIGPYLADLSHIAEEVKGCPPPDLDDFPKAPLEVYSRFGDKMMAIPLNGSATCFVWNKKAFRAAGLDPDQAPKNWQDVYEHGSKLRVDKQYGFNMPAGKSIQCACIWITIFHGFGGSYTDARGQPALNSPAGMRATKFIVEQLQKTSPPGNLTWDFPEMGECLRGWHLGAGLHVGRRLRNPARPQQVGRRIRSRLVADSRGGAAGRLGIIGERGLQGDGCGQALCRLDDLQGDLAAAGAPDRTALPHLGVQRCRGGEEVPAAAGDARRHAGQGRNVHADEGQWSSEHHHL